MTTSNLIKVVVEKRKLGYDCIICNGLTCNDCPFDDKQQKQNEKFLSDAGKFHSEYDNNCVGVFTSPLNKTDKPLKGDEKQFFGKWFIWSGHSWGLNEVCKDVISPKNVENSSYPIHSYSM